MIKESTPISMCEAMEYVEKVEAAAEAKGFMKKFVKLKITDAKELRKKIEELEFMKIREAHVAKIIDLLPGSEDELNKIFTDVGLDEEESRKVLDVIKEFK